MSNESELIIRSRGGVEGTPSIVFMGFSHSLESLLYNKPLFGSFSFYCVFNVKLSSLLNSWEISFLSAAHLLSSNPMSLNKHES